MTINTKTKGMFITFEGIDACGKSTQIDLLQKALNKDGLSTSQLRDPGTTPISENIRKILLDKKNNEMSAITELLLYEAARSQMVNEIINPLLESGTTVLCDRFFDSTTAYQGYARKLDLKIVDQANKIGACGVVPDITFYIDIDPKSALERKKKLNIDMDRLEAEGLLFQEKVREGYLKIYKNNKNRIIFINGSEKIDIIHKKIYDSFCTFRR